MYARQRPDYHRFAPTRRPPPAGPAASAGRFRVDAIKYLALEGGGGKGCAYLGAVIALEELGLLPIPPDGSGRIRGISGASAGAISAFLLALGRTSGEIWQMTQDAEFLQFLDLPAHGRARCATFQDDALPTAQAEQSGGARVRSIEIDLNDRAGLPADVVKAVIALVPLLSKEGKQGDRVADLIAGTILRGLAGRVAKSKSKADDYVFQAVQRDPGGYLMNIAADPGIFPGFGVREFLARQLFRRLRTSSLYDGETDDQLLKHAKRLTFTEFLALTSVDLIIAGTNLSTGKPAYFSNDTTPEFPVIEAVGTSMSIPMFFKSVYIDTDKEAYDAFRGWWADGGVINNYPLHAFNEDPDGQRPEQPSERNALPLNPGTIGLTLEEPDLTPFGIPKPAKPGYPSVLGMIGPLLDAMLFSSTEGQIRNAIERQHTIRLNAYFLETYDLAPDPLLVAATVPEARTKIHQAFEPPAGKKQTSETYKAVLAKIDKHSAMLEEKTSRKYLLKVKADMRG